MKKYDSKIIINTFNLTLGEQQAIKICEKEIESVYLVTIAIVNKRCSRCEYVLQVYQDKTTRKYGFIDFTPIGGAHVSSYRLEQIEKAIENLNNHE